MPCYHLRTGRDRVRGFMSENTPAPVVKLPSSLVQGVEAAICAALGIVRLRHRSSLRSMQGLDEVDLPAIVYRTIAQNWALARAIENKDRSRQNWRWTLQPQIGEANRSPEVMLERAIASACASAGRSDWANQVPVASGLVRGTADGRRAIDLIHRRANGRYELIELKIASDTPLYATVELLGYASLWLLVRQHPPVTAPDILQAVDVDLRVLAPAAFYAPFDLAALEKSVRRGVHLLGEHHQVGLTFAFDVLPARLVERPLPTGLALMDTVAARAPLHCRG